MNKPTTRKKMLFFMEYIGVSEGFNFPGFLVELGWADDEKSAVTWLESLGIFPWDD